MSRRSRRHRSPAQEEKPQTTFFHAPPFQTKKDNSFFQTKLTVNQPGDVHEQEADAVARSVVNPDTADREPVRHKEIAGIQRLSSSMEDESFSTDEERMKRDKDIQRKPDIQREQMKEEEEKPGNVQRMADSGSTAAPLPVAKKIESTSGKGKQLPQETRSAMQHAFGRDFSQVTLHTDNEAVSLNRALKAQAFTHGSDIYFDSGKFDPHSRKGKELLAHELTHVIQQGAAKEKGESKSS